LQKYFWYWLHLRPLASLMSSVGAATRWWQLVSGPARHRHIPGGRLHANAGPKLRPWASRGSSSFEVLPIVTSFFSLLWRGWWWVFCVVVCRPSTSIPALHTSSILGSGDPFVLVSELFSHLVQVTEYLDSKSWEYDCLDPLSSFLHFSTCSRSGCKIK
jgi:hypothetical protein